MKWVCGRLGVLAIVVAVVFWCFPPRGDDAYYHSVGAVEQVRAWQEGAVFPDYQRGWSGGTGSFAPTVYAPIPMAIQGGLAWLVGDGQRAVGFSLSLVVLAAAVSFTEAIGKPEAVLLGGCPLRPGGGRDACDDHRGVGPCRRRRGAGPGYARRTVTVRRGLGLSIGVVLVAGSQVGTLLQLGWLLAVAWVDLDSGVARRPGDLLWVSGYGSRTMAWASAGLMAGAVFWLPLFMDGRNFALGELVEGPVRLEA